MSLELAEENTCASTAVAAYISLEQARMRVEDMEANRGPSAKISFGMYVSVSSNIFNFVLDQPYILTALLGRCPDGTG